MMDTGSFNRTTGRTRQAALGLLATAMLMAPAAHAGDLPDGWEVRGEGRDIIFAPARMNPGEQLDIWAAAMTNYITVSPRASLASLLPQVRQKAGAAQDERCQPPQASPAGEATQTCMAGNSVLVYIMWRRYGDRAYLARIRATGDGALARYRDGIQQILRIVRQNQSDTVLSNHRRQARVYTAQAIRSAPGQGLQDGDIAAVFVAWELAQLPGETVSRMEHTSWLLLKDGTGYRNTIPPDELNVQASRQLEPKRWVKWRKPWLGGDYEILGPNDKNWRRLSQGWIAQPARPGERLNGTYTHAAAYGNWMTGGATHSSTWRFNGDGTFETSYYGSSATGALQAANGSVMGSTAHGNAKGSSATSSVSDSASLNPSATPVAAGGNTRRTNDGASRVGRYRLKGWVLEVERNNGQTDRHFVTFEGSKRNTIDIDSTPFSVSKPKKP